MTSLSLLAYTLGLPSFIAIKVLAPGYYARQDPKTPVKIGLISMGANLVMNLLFVVSMVHWGFAGPHAGLALASSFSATLNATLLYRGLRRSGAYTPGTGWLRLSTTIFLSCAVMAAVLAYWTPGADVWMALGAATRAIDLVLYILAGGLVYILCATALGLRSQHFYRGVH
jgi:putative peptidoglycan lipid II flippase